MQMIDDTLIPSLPAPQGEDVADGPTQEPSADACWSDVGLLHHLQDLFLTFACPTDEFDELLVRELVAIEGAGLGMQAFLACVVLCASRCADSGPAIVYGPWAASSLLARAGGALVDPGVVASAAHAEPAIVCDTTFIDWLRDGHAGFPELILAKEPGDELLGLLRATFPGHIVQLEHAQPSTWLLTVSEARENHVATSDSPGSAPLFSNAQHGVTTFEVTLTASQLWGVVVAAHAAEADLLDCPACIVDLTADENQLVPTLTADWMALLPEQPPLLNSVPSGDATLRSLYEHWSSLFRQPLAIAQSAALVSRAAMVWSLVALTERSPAAAYYGLLSGADAANYAALLRAADSAGVHVKPPNILHPSLRWHIQDSDASHSIQCPLEAVVGVGRQSACALSAVSATTPLSSFFDIFERVPSLLGEAKVVRALVEAHACDELIDRAAILQRWTEVTAWLEAASLSRAAPGTHVPEPPMFDPPAAVAVVQFEDWIEYIGIASPSTVSFRNPDPVDEAKSIAVRRSRAVAATRPVANGERSLQLIESTDDRDNGVSVIIANANGTPLENRSLDTNGRSQMLEVAAGDRMLGVRHEVILNGSPTTIADATAQHVEVTLNLHGERDYDLDLLDRANAVLDAHQGPLQVQLILRRATYRKVVQRDDSRGVSWSEQLVAEMQSVLGVDQISVVTEDVR
ncbi:MAG: hypothetical protein JWO42_2935 [Chloroflexi bacterium]|nr:hypothetical protein [Chloroflexota bacterium]